MKQKQFETAFKKLLKTDKLETIIETSLGQLSIHCLDGWIAMRFLPENFSLSKFSEKFGKDQAINVWSNKWNIHRTTREYCLEELEFRLENLTV
jgi:hypothetical protein